MAMAMAMEASSASSSSPSRSTSSSSSSPSESIQESSLLPLPPPRSRFPLGRRIIHGRVYDSELGVSCHWCRQKTVENHVFCCRCIIAFCGGCLKNRHGEDILVEMSEKVKWVCPKCRGGCGPGCKHCCNCGPCRKSQGLEPTGLLVHAARACGFDNVHDYLIYLKTGESQETISERKLGKGWCQTGQLSPKKRKIADNKTETISLSSDLSETLSVDSTVSSEKNQPHDAIEGSETPTLPRPKSEPEYQRTLAASLHTNNGRSDDPRALSQPPGRVTFVQPKSDQAPQLPASERKRAVISPSLQGGQDLGSKPLLEVKLEGVPFSPVTLLGTSKCHSPVAVKDYVSEHRVKEEFPNHFSQNEDMHRLEGQPVRRPSILLCPKSESASQNEDVSSLECQPARRRPTTLLCPKSEPGSPVARFEAVTGQSSCQWMAKHAAFHLTQPGGHSGYQCNSMGSAFSRSESDVVWSKFHSEFDFRFETSTVENERRSASSSSCDELEIYPKKDEISLLFHVKEETLECGRTEHTPGVIANNTGLVNQRERTNINEKEPMLKELKYSSEVLFDVKVESCIDNTKLPQIGSTSRYYRPEGAFCTVTIKEEREDYRAKDLSPQKCDIRDNRHEVMIDNQMLVKSERLEGGINTSQIGSSVSCSEPIVSVCSITVKQEKKECWDLDSFPQKDHIRECRPSANQDRQGVIVDARTLEVIRVDDDDDDNTPNAYGMKKKIASGPPSHLWMADGFGKKLKARLLEPFSPEELEYLVGAASCRKPVYRARETRQGVSQFILHQEGYSYLDHHPDLDFRLQSTDDPEEKLALLRGFFFWLEHASTLGAYKPWTSSVSSFQTQDDDDCVEIDGPDCEILAVICPVDDEHKPRTCQKHLVY